MPLPAFYLIVMFGGDAESALDKGGCMLEWDSLDSTVLYSISNITLLLEKSNLLL